MLNENSYFIFILKIVNKKHTHTHTHKKHTLRLTRKKDYATTVFQLE